jgi:large subunit ribosomal protein L29
MKYSELKEINSEEIRKTITNLKSETFNLRLQRANGNLEKSSRFSDIRKEVARLETVLSERRIQLATAQATKAN